MYVPELVRSSFRCSPSRRASRVGRSPAVSSPVVRAGLGVAFALAGVRAAHAQCGSWSSDLALGGLFSDRAEAVVIFDDGGGATPFAVVAATSGSGYRPALRRFDGREWIPFVDPATDVRAVAVFDDGAGPVLVVGGAFTSIGGVAANHVARFDGQTWSALGTGTDGTVEALAARTFGGAPRLFVGGTFATAGGLSARNVAAWDGTTWAALGGGVNAAPLAFETFDSGAGVELIAAGTFDEAGGSVARRIARWNGTTWAELGGGLSHASNALPAGLALATWDDGSGPALVVGGSFDLAGGASVASLVRWNGTSFASLGSGVTTAPGYAGIVHALHVHDDGSGPALFVGGYFASAGATPARGIARWDGATWQALGSGLATAYSAVSGEARALATWDDGHGPGLLTLGQFEDAGGRPCANVAAWRGGEWRFVGASNGLAGTLDCLETFDDGSGPALYCGGDLDQASGAARGDLVRWDGASFTAVGAGLGDASATSRVHALRAFDDGSGPALYAGGRFANPNGVGTVTLSRWNGSGWSAVGGAYPNGLVASIVVHDDGSGPALYVAGAFTQVGALPANNVARWDGTSWSAVGLGCEALGGADTPVRCLASYDDGSGAKLYAGGAFLNAGGQLIPYLARWDGTTWSAVGGGVFGPYFATYVRSLSVVDLGTGPKLVVAGTFQDAGPTGSPSVAIWDGAWSTPAWGTANGVFDARIAHDPGDGHGRRLYGVLTSGTTATIATWDGVTLAPLADGALTSEPYGGSGDVRAFASFADTSGGRALFAAGAFRRVGGVGSPALARRANCGEIGRTTCFGDGTTTACPCGNASAPGQRAGCVNSSGQGAALRASGEPSLAHDTIVLAGSGMPDGPVLYFQGAQLLATPVVFGDGLRCTGGPFVRLGVRINVGGASTFPPVSGPGIATSGLLTKAVTRHYQTRFRDAASFCTPATFGYSNALSLIWTP